MRSYKTYVIPLLALIIVIPAALLGRAYLRGGTPDYEALAKQELELCKAATNEADKEICYQKEVPKLMDEGVSMEGAFDVVRSILVMDRGFQSCHVLAHLLTSKEVAKDPSKWKDVVVRSPNDICGSGALHGAFQERFRTESLPDASVATLKPMLDGVCDPRASWQPTLLDRSSCYHGMGHLFLYVTDANVDKSIALCKGIANVPDHDFIGTCLEGIFMQIYQPLEPEDEALIHAIAPIAYKTKSFCAQFTGVVYNTCVKESWPQVPGSADTAAGFEALCKLSTTRDAQLYCAGGLMYPVIETLHYDIPKIEAMCRDIVDPDVRNICWARTASKFVWADWRNVPQAIGICNSAPDESKDSCWKELITYAEQGMEKGSASQKSLCSSMPEPYAGMCTERVGETP